MYTIHHVVAGPTCNAEISAILETQYFIRNPNLRQIDQCVHTGGGTLQAFVTWMNKETGKVFKISDNGVGLNKILAFEDLQAYDTYKAQRDQRLIDPETGREFASYR